MILYRHRHRHSSNKFCVHSPVSIRLYKSAESLCNKVIGTCTEESSCKTLVVKVPLLALNHHYPFWSVLALVDNHKPRAK